MAINNKAKKKNQQIQWIRIEPTPKFIKRIKNILNAEYAKEIKEYKSKK